MITLNRFAQKCLDIMMKQFRMNEHTSRKAFIVRIGVAWRRLDASTRYPDAGLPQYSEDELLAAGMIIYLVAYLKRFGCKDIELLIKDAIKLGDGKED